MVLTDVATPTAFTTNMCCVNQAVNCFLFLFIIYLSLCLCISAVLLIYWLRLYCCLLFVIVLQ